MFDETATSCASLQLERLEVLPGARCSNAADGRDSLHHERLIELDIFHVFLHRALGSLTRTPNSPKPIAPVEKTRRGLPRGHEGLGAGGACDGDHGGLHLG